MANSSNQTSHIDVVWIEQELANNPELFANAADILRRDPPIENIDAGNNIEQIQRERSEKEAQLVQRLGHFLQNEGIIRLSAIDSEVASRARTDPSQKQIIYDLVRRHKDDPANYLNPKDLPSDKSSSEELKKQKASELAARKAKTELVKRYGREVFKAFDPERRKTDRAVSLSNGANLLRIWAVVTMERQNTIDQGEPEAESAAS
jgi:hypothetical protein